VIRRTVRLGIPQGLHARPCSAIAQAMKRFRSQLEIRLGDRTADARSVLEMMTLTAGEGAELELVASGEDEAQLIEAVLALLE
jgi:phosphotransferase system HPr (HPr) family protein